MIRVWGGSTSGTPKFYTILANEVSFGPIPASVMEVEMLFYKKFDNLGSATTSGYPDSVNWLMTNAPDIYLYGSMLEAEPFIMNDERVQLWAQALATGQYLIYRNRIIRIGTLVLHLE